MNDSGAGRGAEHGIRVQLLGGCDIVGPEGALLSLPSRKARALVGLLSVSDGMSLPRERICGLLWAETGEEQARASLRQSIKLIKQALGPDLEGCVISDRLAVALDRAKVGSDVGELLTRIADEDLSSPSLLRSELHLSLLAGLENLDESFDAWLAVWRETVRRQLQTVLERGMRPDRDEDHRTLAAAALLALDPAHEPAVRYLMGARVAAGDRPGALRMYDAFRARLREDYDAAPEPETDAAFAAIRDEATRPAPAVQPSLQINPHQVTVISVLEVPSGDPDADAANHVFATGLRGMLARFRNLTVVSVDPDKRPDGGPAISYLLRLVPMTAKGEVSLSVHLTDRTSGATVWSNVVNLDATAAAASRETVLRGVSGALDVYLSQARLAQLRLREPQSLSAFEKWMRGQQLLDIWQPEADARAEQLFLEALHTWPDHATLHANLADLYNTRHIVYPGVMRKPELERKAMQLARRAVALDPLDPRCHVTLGWSLAMAGRVEQAAHSFMRGHDLNPADPAIAMSAAHGLAILDRLPEAFRLCRAAFTLHPSPPWSFWGFESNLRFLAADYAGAVEAAD
ncbi:MAG: BTAD domain-containing putative transcriptional regulator, partial [Gemmobacter sp.]|nr:BTAD domain-containing putative transcriptional regulator [Gemmobacter sp.]